jgi:protein-tyrosine phosphatase
MGLCDLHSHVLPALDDGAVDLATSGAMLAGLRDIGFSDVCATPHQKAAQFLPDLADIQAAYEQARGQTIPGLTLHLAAENFWDDVFFARSQGREAGFPRYDGGKAFLFEIHPEDVPVRLEDTLFQLSVRGFLPVMAHPERYRPLCADEDRLARLGQSTALVVDLGALAGYHGFRAGRTARRLVAEGIAHAAASDVHSPSDVRAAAEGISWIKKKLGPAAVTRLLDENPRRILAGELPDA